MKHYRILETSKFSYYKLFFNSSTARHSTCEVNGNISTGCTSTTSYISSIIFKSLIIVAALQLMYTTLSVFNFIISSIVFSSNPLLGGSTIITSGLIFSFLINSSNASSTSPQINSTLLILFKLALIFASSIACGTISIP